MPSQRVHPTDEKRFGPDASRIEESPVSWASGGDQSTSATSLVLTMLAACCPALVLMEAGRWIAAPGTDMSFILPASGYVVAVATLQQTWSRWIAAVLGAAVAGFVFSWFRLNGGVAECTVASASMILEAAAGSLLLWRLSKKDPAAEGLASAFAMVVPAAGAAGVVSATLMVGCSMYLAVEGNAEALPEYTLVHAWVIRALACYLGVLFITPPVLWLWVRRSRVVRPARVMEAALIFLTAGLATWLIFRSMPSGKGTALGLICLPFPVLVLAASRLSVSGTAMTGLLIAVVMIVMTNVESGPMEVLSAGGSDQVIGMQAYLALVVFPSLLLAGAISDKTLGRELLAASESRFRSMFERHDAMMLLVDVQTRKVIDANHAAVRFFGYPREALRSMPVSRLKIASEDEVARAMSLAAEGRKNTFVVPHRLANGAVRLVETHSTPMDFEGRSVLFSVMQDVTQRAEAEAALVESEKKYRAIFEGSHDAIVVFDPSDKRVLEVNARACELYGYAREEFIGLGLDALTMDAAARDKRIAIALARGWHVDYSAVGKRSDGATLHLDLSVSVVDYQGRRAILSLSRDATARVEAEKALRVSEAKYRAFVAQSTEGVWCIDLPRPVPISLDPDAQITKWFEEATLVECNDAMARMYGLRKAADMVGTPLRRVLVMDDPRNWDYLRAFIKGGYRLDGAESHEKAADGSDRYFLNSLVAIIENGCVARAWGTQRDITEKKIAEMALADAQARLRVAVEGAELGTWRLDIGADALDCDANYAKMFGLQHGTTRVPRAEVLSKVNEEDRDTVYTAYRRSVKTGEPYRVEFRVNRADGERWLSSRGTVHLDEKGHAVWIAGATSDITDAKRAERERAGLQAQLEHAQRLESLGVMAGGIAHDFNNLLVGVLGNAGLAMKLLPDNAPARERILQIEQAARHASDLTRQLLRYAGQGKGHPTPVAVNTLLVEMAQLLEVSISKSVAVQFELGEELPMVLADPSMLRQVVLNLLTNASDAIGENEGVITLRTGTMDADAAYLSRTYLPSDAPEGQYAFIEVTDTGRGMDEATLARVFDPFFTTKFTGRGLGLAVVLGVVKEHRGAVKVNSTPGEGTSFRVLLPVLDQIPAFETIETKPSPVQASKGGRILIVDDEPMVREVASQILTVSGWHVTSACGGKEALEMLSEGCEFDAALVDLTMPGMSGLELLGEIRVLMPELPVILTSGYAADVAGGDIGSADGFVAKPFTMEALIAAIEGAKRAKASSR